MTVAVGGSASASAGVTDLALQLDEGLEMSRPKPVDGEWHVTRLSGVIKHNAKSFTDGRLPSQLPARTGVRWPTKRKHTQRSTS